jgi:hypothetical protein
MLMILEMRSIGQLEYITNNDVDFDSWRHIRNEKF